MAVSVQAALDQKETRHREEMNEMEAKVGNMQTGFTFLSNRH